MNIALAYEWRPVENGPGIPYQFPEKISSHFRSNWGRPAVYRWRILQHQSGASRRLYVGETHRLSQRINQYVNPGPTQKTNQRLNAFFEQELRSGHKIALEVLEFEPFNLEEFTISMHDLRDKPVRRFLENLFEIYHRRSGFQVLNA